MPIVTEFDKVNAYFQATNIDANELVKQFHFLYESFTGRVYNKKGDALPLDSVDFGGKFILEAMNLIKNNGNDCATIMKVNEAKGRCHSMLLDGASQLRKRLPASQDLFKRLAYLHPSRILNQVDRPSLLELPMQHLMHVNMAEIDSQYRSILQINWQEVSSLKEGIPKEAVPFWSGVAEYKNMLGEHPFGALANYALSCLTTPISNALVERIFSLVTSVKTKPRNRMSTKLLEVIVRIRLHLQFGERCCKDFIVTPRMLSLFSMSYMYKRNETDIDHWIEDLFDI